MRAEAVEKYKDKLASPKNIRDFPICPYYSVSEQKELFSRYTDAVREYQTMAECLLLHNSLKLGARMILEVMKE